MIPLAQKIEQLKARYQGETSLPPHEALAICESLRLMVEIEQSRVTALGERIVQFDDRLQALERTAPTYNPDARRGG